MARLAQSAVNPQIIECISLNVRCCALSGFHVGDVVVRAVVGVKGQEGIIIANTNYLAGRRFEYERIKHWREVMGYPIVLRTAGSKGAYDIIAIHPDKGVELIQCKLTDSPATANRLINTFRNETRPVKGAHQIMEVKVRGSKEIRSFAV